MEKENRLPSLAEIRSRREAIAEEDRILAEVERALLQAQETWQSLYAEARLHIGQFVQPAAISKGAAPLSRFSAIAPKRSRTKREMIVDALNEPHPLWQTANDVQAYVSKTCNRDIPMSSISPELTALKNNGAVSRREKFVALTLRLEEESKTKEAPADESESASKSEKDGTANTGIFS